MSYSAGGRRVFFPLDETVATGDGHIVAFPVHDHLKAQNTVWHHMLQRVRWMDPCCLKHWMLAPNP